MNTWHIHIEGQVQGVGFRPFVYLLARDYGLKGWVNNTVDGVHIVFNAEENLARKFSDQILERAPRLSKITALHRNQIPKAFFDRFRIIQGGDKGIPQLLLTPDFALCEDCRKELHQPENRRYKYSFITCTNCGPRYSIIHGLPYDRKRTKMDAFQMCSACKDEYEAPLDRRYYSQTNSCADCGVTLSLFGADKKLISQNSEEIITQVVDHWAEGKIIAIKGIGGYLLTCDAANKTAVLTLRQRKYRPTKPFALLLPEISNAMGLSVDKNSIAALKSPVAPIVLLEKQGHSQVIEEIAPGLNQIGVMLPYTPLYDNLLRIFGRAIVATSANISNSPIVFEDQKALDSLLDIADFVLANDREIVIPQDDSVLKFSLFEQQKIILRRSRGLAPTYINAALKWSSKSVLAMGAMLKSTFSILHRENIYISQYLGDLAHFDTQQSYQYTLNHFMQLLAIQPEVLLVDEHAAYPSSEIGQQFAKNWKIPIQKIQHHKAHFGAILGEHQLIDTEDPVLGVIWDGTGLGTDGHIWGGEFFTYQQYDVVRCNHLCYFDSILGDKMPKEPRISALSACWGIEGAETWLEKKFSPTEWQIYQNILGKPTNLQTSSMGRIFDAVASLLGLMDKQSYEGEAAMQLEALATQYVKKNGLNFSESYLTLTADDLRIPTKRLLANLLADLRQGKAVEYIAARFHFTLVRIIEHIANNLKIKKIALSGGVFQNSLLVDLLSYHLKNEFDLYFHQQLAPNDENISFGQLVCFQIDKQKESFINDKSKKHVFSNSR